MKYTDAEFQGEPVKDIQKYFENSKPPEISEEFNDLKNKAGGVGTVAMLFFAITIIMVIIALVTTDDRARIISLSVGGASFSLSLVLFIVSHLIHIRAALEKIAAKK